jgi:hypothetical protein
MQFVWALLVMSLIGNMIATAYAGNPAIVNYSMFVAVFSMLSLLYLIPASIKESFMIHPLLVVGLDVLNALFYFCAAVAMSAYLHVHSCSNRVSYNQTCSTCSTSNNTNRLTPPPTSSPTALATPTNVAPRPRLPLPSSGSASWPLSFLPSLPVFRAAILASTCAVVPVASERDLP